MLNINGTAGHSFGPIFGILSIVQRIKGLNRLIFHIFSLFPFLFRLFSLHFRPFILYSFLLFALFGCLLPSRWAFSPAVFISFLCYAFFLSIYSLFFLQFFSSFTFRFSYYCFFPFILLKIICRMQSISHKSYIIFFYFIHFKLFQLPLNIDNKFGIEFTRIKIRKVIGEFEKGRYLKEKMITM